MKFDALILKIASRCNLNCSYCFMYNLGDNTYKNQPKFMDVNMIDSILEKTASYIIANNQKRFSFIFHGGEPLLMDKEFFRIFVTKANKIKEQLQDVSFYYLTQTNGVLIDEAWCELFNELKIYPSVSVDGTKMAHDMYRLDHKGNGSYDKVFKGVATLKEKTGIADIVCVINVNEDPLATYASFKEMGAVAVNYLIPDYTHDNFPFDSTGEKTPMADWLIQLFDIWISDTSKYNITMFSGLINAILGLVTSKNNESTVLVIETNGEIEAVDSLKACGHGFTKSGLNIKTNEFTDIINSPLGKLYFEDSTTKLAAKCNICPVKSICKGGRLVHRFKKENGFNNPSVYCHDLIKIIAHIQNKMFELFPDLYTKENITAMDTNEIITYLNETYLTTKDSVFSDDLEFFSTH